MSERTVDLIRTDLQQAKNEAKKNILLPVREVSDLLALVDSLQQQVDGLNEESLANFQTAAERGKQIAERDWTIKQLESVRYQLKTWLGECGTERDALREQLAERDRTIDLLTKQITDEVGISAKAIAERDMFKTSFEHWNKEAHRVVNENSKLRKALEEIADSKKDMSGVLCRVAARQALGRD
ncbi:hypothetical protein [Paenibacillus polymyxa]|uniref:hypothetical protein n=1 Tax=Paenibacillus polymyxa TaxID=1406 RepID=UPI0007EA09A4|nr:hypothetical protein [Paenibacillus polymyxa]OAZ43384.1 hypothetical protein A9Z39_22360 [Paenibacillus polymyxa]